MSEKLTASLRHPPQSDFIFRCGAIPGSAPSMAEANRFPEPSQDQENTEVSYLCHKPLLLPLLHASSPTSSSSRNHSTPPTLQNRTIRLLHAAAVVAAPRTGILDLATVRWVYGRTAPRPGSKLGDVTMVELELELEIWRDVSLWLMMRDADIAQGARAQGGWVVGFGGRDCSRIFEVGGTEGVAWGGFLRGGLDECEPLSLDVRSAPPVR